METTLSIVALVLLVGALSSIGGRLVTRKGGALWVWDRSTPIGWALIVLGAGLIVVGFLIDREGVAMSTKLGLGSLLLVGGLWMIW